VHWANSSVKRGKKNFFIVFNFRVHFYCKSHFKMGIFGINYKEEFKNKSDLASKIYRDEGNRFFKRSLTFQALINYNKALNFAKSQVG
jgi:hypothetical protein